MAPHVNRLVEVGRDGFAVLDIIYSPRLMAREARNRYIPQQSHETVQDTAAPYRNDVIDSNKAAKKYKGVIIMEINKGSKVPGWSF